MSLASRGIEDHCCFARTFILFVHAQGTQTFAYQQQNYYLAINSHRKEKQEENYTKSTTLRPNVSTSPRRVSCKRANIPGSGYSNERINTVAPSVKPISLRAKHKNVGWLGWLNERTNSVEGAINIGPARDKSARRKVIG